MLYYDFTCEEVRAVSELLLDALSNLPFISLFVSLSNDCLSFSSEKAFHEYIQCVNRTYWHLMHFDFLYSCLVNIIYDIFSHALIFVFELIGDDIFN